jgi:hypothetical protein
MPDQPSWIERVSEILASLNSAEAPPFLDRPAIETLFGLRRRQAIELLHRCGGYQVGKTFLVPREALVRFLEDPRYRWAASTETARFEHVRLALGQFRQQLEQRRISIPATPDAFRLEFSGLPDGIRIEAGQLTVSFDQPSELLEKLFALARALANDYDTFERSFAAARHTPDARLGDVA